MYREFLRVINGLLKLSSREIDVLEWLIKLDIEWKPKSNNDIKNILSTENRRLIMRETMIRKSNFTKYINVLKDKGLIIESENRCYQVLPDIIPIKTKDNNIEIIFNIEGYEG